MNYSSANINIFWGNLVVEELVRNGITQFCLSPGSRSTPLAVAAATHKSANVRICLDERGAAFFALGYTRGSNKPAAIICTSGTAAANFFPAVVEAYHSRLPLIVLTADRPPELRGTGANQTIDQVKIYGKYANWFFDFPCPDENVNPAFVLSTIDQAVIQALSEPAGPVHLNFMFREPLAPELRPVSKRVFRGISAWSKSNLAFTSYARSTVTAESKTIQDLYQKLKKINRGLILAGQMKSQKQVKYIVQLAEYLNWPVFADVLSGLNRNHRSRHVINYFDNLLLNKTFRKETEPEMILQFGRPFTSRKLLQFIKDVRPSAYIVVEETADRLDPEHAVTGRFTCLPQQLAEIMSRGKVSRLNSGRLKKMKNFDLAAHEVVSKFCTADLTEISIAQLLSELVPANTGLFLGSSMPVRDADMYGSFTVANIVIRANRGASGIDGSIASAAGLAQGIQNTVTAVVGDLAALHDLNSFRLLSESPFPVIVVIINNDGGGIFSFLPISNYDDLFVKYFASPHGLNFEHASEMFGLAYYSPRSADEFISCYKNVLKGKKSVVLEIQSERQNNFRLHQQLQRKISRLNIQ